MNKKIKLILASLLLISGIIFYSCTKEEFKQSEPKIEKRVPKMASPGYEAMLKKLAKIIGEMFSVTIDVKSGFYEAYYYPNGQLWHFKCNPGDAICVLHISTFVGPTNPDFLLNALLGINDKGELLCCINESEDTAAYKRLVKPEGYIDLTSDLIIDDENILSTFGISSPIEIKKGKIPFQSIEGVTIINLGIH
ncbi:MAG: hypothetical protein ACOYOV_03305 [Bacteroidales bacterium]